MKGFRATLLGRPGPLSDTSLIKAVGLSVVGRGDGLSPLQRGERGTCLFFKISGCGRCETREVWSVAGLRACEGQATGQSLSHGATRQTGYTARGSPCRANAPLQEEGLRAKRTNQNRLAIYWKAQANGWHSEAARSAVDPRVQVTLA
jgi:hypothetical protein